MSTAIGRRDVLRFRVGAQQFDRTEGTLHDTAILDIGVQDTGPDGGLWALAVRGPPPPAVQQLSTVWTIRGAPHLYRRADLPVVARAVAPLSEADAGKRIYDAAKPLKAAGIDSLAALDQVASAMRQVVTQPMVKGEVSQRVTELLPEPFLRYCRPCHATHPYEMPFRLAALGAGLELQPGTSPPVLMPIAHFAPAASHPPAVDPIRAYLRLLGPATPKHVAAYLDAPVADVRARWPDDAVTVSVEGEARSVLAADEARLRTGAASPLRLLGPFDLFLQARDRQLLVADPAHAKSLWPVLGRPGAVLVGGEIVGIWRPRKAGTKFRIQVELWTKAPRSALHEQAERLAAHRGLPLAGVDIAP